MGIFFTHFPMMQVSQRDRKKAAFTRRSDKSLAPISCRVLSLILDEDPSGSTCTWVRAVDLVTAVIAIRNTVALLHRADVTAAVGAAYRVVGATLARDRPRRAILVLFVVIVVVRDLRCQARNIYVSRVSALVFGAVVDVIRITC